MTKSAEWAARLEAWRASGKSANDFCAEHGYSAKNLVWWSSHFRRKSAPTVKRQRVILARVVRKPREVRPTPAAVVVQIGEARIEVAAGADRAALVRIPTNLGSGSSLTWARIPVHLGTESERSDDQMVRWWLAGPWNRVPSSFGSTAL